MEVDKKFSFQERKSHEERTQVYHDPRNEIAQTRSLCQKKKPPRQMHLSGNRGALHSSSVSVHLITSLLALL